MAMLATFILLAGMATPSLAQIATTQMAAHARAAQEAEQRNDFPAAVHEYEALAKSLPQNAEVQSNLGVALYFDHELPRAIAVFRKAIALNPALLAPHLFSGLAWYHLSNPDAAAPELEKAVHLNPSDVIARTWLGYAYSAQGQDGAAAKEFQAACRLDPSNVDAWYGLGESYLQLGKEATHELLTIAPDGGRAWQLAGEQFQLQGDSKKALKDFEEANRRRPDIAELRTSIASLGGTAVVAPSQARGMHSREDSLYRHAHDAEQKSHAAFERVIQLAPDSYRAHQIMADAYVSEQHAAKAIEEYRTVLKLKPDLPGIHEKIGNELLQNGKLPEALKEFEAELQIQPQSPGAHANAAQALLMMGKDDAARKMLAGVLQMDQPPPEIYRLLGKLELQSKDYHSAVKMLTHYLSLKKDDATAYYLLSRAYRALGEKQQMNHALSMFEKTSREMKAHSTARRELEPLANQNQAGEQALRNTAGRASSEQD